MSKSFNFRSGWVVIGLFLLVIFLIWLTFVGLCALVLYCIAYFVESIDFSWEGALVMSVLIAVLYFILGGIKINMRD